MALEMYLPHTAVWRKVGPRPAEAGGVDGSEDKTEKNVRAFFDPLAPAQAESRFGVTGTVRPHLFMVDPEYCQPVEGDVFEWNDMELVVRAKRSYGFEDTTIEGVASARTKGRM